MGKVFKSPDIGSAALVGAGVELMRLLSGRKEFARAITARRQLAKTGKTSI